jgi:hypothetical protein
VTRDYDRPDTSPFDEPLQEEQLAKKNLDSGKAIIWKGMSVAELVRHMADLRRHLPPTELVDINVEEELLLQFAVMREFQSDIITDGDTAANQRAQVGSAVSKLILDIADRQREVYSSERVKRLETALIRTCRDHMPEEACAQFLEAYERIAREMRA